MSIVHVFFAPQQGTKVSLVDSNKNSNEDQTLKRIFPSITICTDFAPYNYKELIGKYCTSSPNTSCSKAFEIYKKKVKSLAEIIPLTKIHVIFPRKYTYEISPDNTR